MPADPDVTALAHDWLEALAEEGPAMDYALALLAELGRLKQERAERDDEMKLAGALAVDAPSIVKTFRRRALARALRYRGQRDRMATDLVWERDEHDKARTEWLLLRDRLNGFREACENALSTTEPPSGYEEPWCNYEGEIEAAPWAWLATLIGEALADFEPFDHEGWADEEEKRKAEYRDRAERVAAAERERDAAVKERDKNERLIQVMAEDKLATVTANQQLREALERLVAAGEHYDDEAWKLAREALSQSRRVTP